MDKKENNHHGFFKNCLKAGRAQAVAVALREMRLTSMLIVAAFALWSSGCNKPHDNSGNGQETENIRDSVYRMVRGSLGTYATPPRLSNGMVDEQKLIDELRDIHANTYNWLIWRGGKDDYDGLKHFLPAARRAGLKVWVTLVPPSEPPMPQPFGQDYDKWATELATLSKSEPNLVAWSIDDFVHNLKFFTPGYVERFLLHARAINPRFAFVPCCYFKYVTDSFAADYGHLVDGILFPYRAESSGNANLKDPALVANEIDKLKDRLGADIPVIVDVYASAHSQLGSTTPEYVQQVITAARKRAEGVMIYTHQDPVKNKDKYDIIKGAFE